MSNTLITALTLDNANRHVYFQEPTGAFRRTVYSSQAKIWQTTADTVLVADAKTSTPLAVILSHSFPPGVSLLYLVRTRTYPTSRTPTSSMSAQIISYSVYLGMLLTAARYLRTYRTLSWGKIAVKSLRFRLHQ